MKLYEKTINQGSERLIELKRDIHGINSPRKKISLGKSSHASFINIERGDIIIDGGCSKIDIEVNNDWQNELSLIHITKSAKNVTLRNMNIKIHLTVEHTNNKFYCIYNCAEGLRIENCNIEIQADNQVNICGIYNYGNKDAGWNAHADNVSIRDTKIKVECHATQFPNECSLHGVYNTIGDTLSIINSMVTVNNDGEGENQTAVGVFTDGMFGRFIGNNIKAQTPHVKGVLREKAHAIGFKNAGQYSLISDNNIIAERAGSCIGLDNTAQHVKISGNKILATHTVWGRTIRNSGAYTIIDSNLILSTAKNSRLLEQNTHSSIITSNVIRISIGPPLAVTGCGIYNASKDSHHNIISGNMIKNLLHCGIYSRTSSNTILNNEILSDFNSMQRISEPNQKFEQLFDENRIKSIT